MFQDSSYEINEDEKIAIFALDYLISIANLTSVTSERFAKILIISHFINYIGL